MPTRPAKSAPAAAPASSADAAQAFGCAVGDIWRSFAGLNLPQQQLAKLQGEYLREATAVWNASLQRLQGSDTAPLPDRRFAADDWASNPLAAHLAQLYLLNARTLLQMAESLEGDEKARQRVRFAVQQWIDAASPSNFLALNPEALRKALDTQGRSIAQGMQMLLADLQRGQVSQTDTSVFEVGRNVATTEGAVVYENELIQLIEYKPLTAQIHERPFLFVPPCINKYYILDLQPSNSLVRYAVEQGMSTFVLSWCNPDAALAHKTWDDYIEDALIKAIAVVREITRAEQINALGFCVGGTMLGTALAVLAARGEKPVASATFLTAFLDFTDTGVLDVFIDENFVCLREQQFAQGGLLPGRDLATTFSFLRPTDLVWNYVVGNYLKGETPPPFDLLYWNSDSTRMPARMHSFYLRRMYQQNDLVKPGAIELAGVKLDLRKIKVPAYILSTREDHIAPWTSTYRATQIYKGPVRFVLAASGHIAGVVNPPDAGKYSHWVNTELPPDPDAWLVGGTELAGSWWPDWQRWVASLSKAKVDARVPGDGKLAVIEPAPGSYVKVTAQ